MVYTITLPRFVRVHVHVLYTCTYVCTINLVDGTLCCQVIQVFEDSCGSEWLGQVDNSSGDGAYSPSVWLVTPLISKLQHSVLGRVLKCAGQVLGQGQWWNPDRNQEKRRSTRATRYGTCVYCALGDFHFYI